MALTLEERPNNPYPFGIFHISLGPTLCTESELKSDWTVENVPSLVESEELLLQMHFIDIGKEF